MLFFLFTKTPLHFFLQDLWRDESFSYVLAKHSIFDILKYTAQDFNPPFYYLILHFWMYIFGSSEIAMRSLSLVFYLLTVYIAVDFIMEVFHVSLKKSLLYALLVFINPLLVYYAFEARMYSMFGFFTLLSFYSFLTNKKRLYLISSTLGLYTHYFMIFGIITQILYILILEHTHIIRDIRKNAFKHLLHYIKLEAIPLLAFAPWVLFLLTQKRFSGEPFWIDPVTFKDFVHMPAILYTGYQKELGFLSILPPDALLLRISFILVALVIVGGFYVYMRKSKENKQIFTLLLLWTLLPAVTVFVISLFYPLFIPRYLIVSGVGIMFLIIFSLIHSPPLLRYIFLLLILINTFSYHSLQDTYRLKDTISPKYLEVKALMKPTDVVYVRNVLEYFDAQYYLKTDKVYVYGGLYSDIPSYVGKSLIPKDHVVNYLPNYPHRAFVLNYDGKFDIKTSY